MAAMQDSLNRTGVQLPFSGVALMIVAGIVGAVILALLATLGGVIGVAIFEKRKGDGSAPPPPQNLGGTPGSYGSGL
jgi:zinc transporter ZupT